MSFAAREIGSVTGSSGARNATFTVVVGQGFNQYGRWLDGISYFWGWCPNEATQGSIYPDAAIGSCSTTNPGLNSLAVIGVYSVGLNLPNNASYYYLLLAGNVTTGITSLTIGGSAVGSGPTSYTYDSTNNCTRVLFTPATVTTTLFGTTVGASKTVVIT